MYRRGQNVRTAAQRLAGVDTERLRASIAVDLVPKSGSWGARVGTSLGCARAHNEGHGPIRPAVVE